MADSYTPHYNFIRPEPGGSVDTWGNKLNSNWGDLDSLLNAVRQELDAVVDSALAKANNLSDLTDVDIARTNLGLNSAATHPDSRYMHRASNLSDVDSANLARSNLGLGTAATLDAAEVLRADQNLLDVDDAADARSNLGLGTAAVEPIGRFLQVTNSLSELTNLPGARSNLGLGTAATYNDDRYLHRANNFSDVPSREQARSNLGLGAAATADLTSSRTSSSITTALTAEGMNAHRTSGDHDDRYLRKNANDTMNGNLSVTGNITAYSSDARLKKVLENLDELPDLMSRLGRIQTVLYAWDEDACEEACFSPDKDVELGVLAQDVRAVFPELVSAAPFNEDYLTVDYARLSVIALAGVKQLSAEIKELKSALKRRTE